MLDLPDLTGEGRDTFHHFTTLREHSRLTFWDPDSPAPTLTVDYTLGGGGWQGRDYLADMNLSTFASTTLHTR